MNKTAKVTGLLVFALIILSSFSYAQNENGLIIINDIGTPSLWDSIQKIFGLQSTVPPSGIGTGESNDFYMEFEGRQAPTDQLLVPAKMQIAICTGTFGSNKCVGNSGAIYRTNVAIPSENVNTLQHIGTVTAIKFTLIAPNVAGQYNVCAIVLGSSDNRISAYLPDCADFTVTSNVIPFCPATGTSNVKCNCMSSGTDCVQSSSSITGGTLITTTCYNHNKVSDYSCPRTTVALSQSSADCNSGYVVSGNTCVVANNDCYELCSQDIVCLKGDYGSCSSTTFHQSICDKEGKGYPKSVSDFFSTSALCEAEKAKRIADPSSYCESVAGQKCKSSPVQGEDMVVGGYSCSDKGTGLICTKACTSEDNCPTSPPSSVDVASAFVNQSEISNLLTSALPQYACKPTANYDVQGITAKAVADKLNPKAACPSGSTCVSGLDNAQILSKLENYFVFVNGNDGYSKSVLVGGDWAQTWAKKTGLCVSNGTIHVGGYNFLEMIGSWYGLSGNNATLAGLGTIFIGVILIFFALGQTKK